MKVKFIWGMLGLMLSVQVLAKPSLGSAIMQTMQSQDREKLQYVLDNYEVDEVAYWRNYDTGYRYQIIPVKAFSRFKPINEGDKICRDVFVYAIFDSVHAREKHLVCKDVNYRRWLFINPKKHPDSYERQWIDTDLIYTRSQGGYVGRLLSKEFAKAYDNRYFGRKGEKVFIQQQISGIKTACKILRQSNQALKMRLNTIEHMDNLFNLTEDLRVDHEVLALLIQEIRFQKQNLSHIREAQLVRQLNAGLAELIDYTNELHAILTSVKQVKQAQW